MEITAKGNDIFIQEFIKCYKDNPVLWNQKHPKYKNRTAREEALEALIAKTKEFHLEADLDFVKTKIDSLRCAFRREHKKVQLSKLKSNSSEDEYVPALWYYNLLLFTVGEESMEKDASKKSITPYFASQWSKESTVILIELLKKYPMLHSMKAPENGTKYKRFKAYRDLTRDFVAQTGHNFDVLDVRKKISTLKQQFSRECKYRANKQFRKASKLWCYDLMTFIKDSLSDSKKTNINAQIKSDKADQTFSEDDTDNWIENYGRAEGENKLFIQEDLFDTIGKNVAVKLRDMTDDQRIYAQNLINELMYNGLMEKLSADTRISFTGD